MTGRRLEWASACCVRCGAPWTQRSSGAGSLRYDRESDSIVCKRGVGCSRRPDDHTREGLVETRDGATRRALQYKHGESWWSVQDIVDALPGVAGTTIYRRLKHGWTVEDVLARTADFRETRPNDEHRHLALERAVEQHKKASKV